MIRMSSIKNWKMLFIYEEKAPRELSGRLDLFDDLFEKFTCLIFSYTTIFVLTGCRKERRK